MNVSFASDLHGAYADGVYALLTVVADPATHKARLDELIAQENAAKEQIAALNEMAADTRRMNTAAQAATIVLNKRKTALDEREAALNERAKSLEQHEGKVSAASLQRRENLVAAREVSVQAREQAAARQAEQLDAKHARIRDLSANL